MAGQPQTPTNKRYSLRTRTPAKAAESPIKEASAPTPTPRKRAKTTGSMKKTRKGALTPTKARGKGKGGANKHDVPATAAEIGDAYGSMDFNIAASDDETQEVQANGKSYLYLDEEVLESSNGNSSKRATTPRKGPGRPRKNGRKSFGDSNNSLPTTPAKKAAEARRIPVHLTKYDAFRSEQLEEATRILHGIPVSNDSPTADRYELMKMSEALKMCSYELDVVDLATEPINEVYRLLSWSVHATGPLGAANPPPPLSDAAKSVLLRVFASIGNRIREETKDMAGYQRRHALRKLILAEYSETPGSPSTAATMTGVDEEIGTPTTPKSSREQVAHRRNPLRIPGPLVDIWKEPYKKAAAEDGGHESQASDA
ncbi:hypothetical protein COEREDRAFT_83299 [Coemansia reversa NRRL 1564]|uniref:Uncharacterized protein n=1 Tax=Coemansia reversa (strain ATCC 12441 / NRRL 1564) TaxID=763665 RepID=A0A2G5B3W4_COERN|nr:hypothetical protein COEREDRAFT_83299 [Coemansia reversa NRRL 1564]|eukprot:PIA13699.1 hypothetical protein COEREDRAFT_83299 [Coemansia reversa NRRL 1564]